MAAVSFAVGRPGAGRRETRWCQQTRHRIASISQKSQRYVDGSNPSVVIPPSITGNVQAKAVFDQICQQIAQAYRELRELKIRKEDARFVLANATATKLAVTMNFREWRHFINIRCDEHAQWEIRTVANSMLKILHSVAPSVFHGLYQKFGEN